MYVIIRTYLEYGADVLQFRTSDYDFQRQK